MPLETAVFDWYGTLASNSSALLSHSKDLLHDLYATRIRIGIITSASSAAVRETLADNGIDFCVKAVVGDEICPHGGLIPPPQPGSILYCLGKMNALPKTAVYIGDEPADISAAGFARMPCIGIAYTPGSHYALTAAWAKSIARSPEELRAHLRAMMRPSQARLFRQLH